MSLMTPSAFAVGETITFATSANVSGVKTGDTFEVTLDSSEINGAYSGDFKISFDKTKLKVASISWNTAIPGTAPSTVDEANSNGFAAKGYVDNINYEALTIPDNTHFGTVTFAVLNAATSGSTDINLESYQFTDEYSATLSGITVNTKKITITIVSELTGNLPVAIDKPVKGEVPQSTISATTQYTGSITWTPAVTGGKFAANTAYTATVTLTAKTGYQFANDVNPTVAGSDRVTDVKVKDSGSKLEFKATFPATAAKDPLKGTVSLNSTAWRIDNPMNVGTSGITSAAPLGTLSYQWYRVDTAGAATLIPSATGSSYTPSTKDDVGKKLKVVVTAENYSGSLEATSPYTVSKKPYDGPTPTAPTGITPTSNFVSFTKTENYYYAVKSAAITTAPSSGWTNQDGFSGLTPNTSYKLWYRIGETDIMESSSADYVEFTTLKSSATITIAAPGTIIYDGSAVEVGSGKDLNYTYDGDGAVTVKWYANNGGSVGSALSGAPTNAGTYWIGVSAAEGTNSAAVAEVTKKFTISQKALTNDMIILGTQATYDGTAHGPVYSVKDGATVLNKGTDYTETSGYSPVTNVGNTTLKISGAGNYKGTAQKDWSLVAKDVTITPDAKSKTYGAADPELTYSTDLTAGSALETAFNTAKSGALSYTGTDVGAYIIEIGTLKAGNNFNLKMNTTAVFFTINQATPVITATTPRQLVNNGVEVDISNWASFTNTDSGATLTYTLDTTPAGITLVGNKLKAASSVAAGSSFDIKVNAYGTHNFTAPAEFTITVNVVNKVDAGVSITTPPASKTYGDANFTLTATKTAPDGGTWSWISSNSAILEIVSGADTAMPTIKVKKADTTGATLTVTYTSSTHYGSANTTITVAQKEVTISGITAANKEYDGSTTAIPTGTAVINGKVGSDDVTVTAGTATFADKNVGTGKTVTFTGYSLSGADAGNYNLKAQPASVTANITAKVVKLTGGINATDRSYVKDNKTVGLTKGTLTFDGLVSGETLDVNIPTTGTISDAKVGAYNVTYSGVILKDGTTGKASNYKLVSPLPTVTVNITKASAPALSNIPVSQKYNVTTGEKVISSVMPADAGTLTYTKGTESKTGSVTVTSWAVDATGKVTYTLSGGKVNDTVTLSVVIKSTNYADATVNVVITIIKATPTGEPAYTKITTSGKTLNDAALTTTGSTLNPNAGTLVWVDNAGNVLPDTTAVAANTTYKWLFTPTDTNYESISGTIKLWSKSSGGSGSYYPAGITFTTDLPVGTINRVAVNGKTLDTKNYVVNGSDVTLLQSYLDTLKAGKYTVKIENKTHVSTGTFTIKADGTLSSPRTADAGVCLYAAMALMSGTGAAYVTLRRKKEN